MTTISFYLDERKEEFDAHIALAQALQDRMMLDDDSSIGSVQLSARHINTIKSGLLVHLYNIEESVLSQSLDFLGSAIGAAEPSTWNEHSLREWLRESVVSRVANANDDRRLDIVCESTIRLRSSEIFGPQKLKKPSGTWDDRLIKKVVERLNIHFQLPEHLAARIEPKAVYGDLSPLQFLGERRNAIAHGQRSFEDGASDLQLSDITELGDVTLEYLAFFADAVQRHVAANAHLLPAA